MSKFSPQEFKKLSLPWIKISSKVSTQSEAKPGQIVRTFFFPSFGWLQPYTDKTLESLPKEGKKNILTICPGFASDCVETLEEILIQGKESFLSSGGENFDMIPCLNDNDDHITLLKSLIEKNI